MPKKKKAPPKKPVVKKTFFQHKPVAIITIAILLIGFTFFVMQMVQNISPQKSSRDTVTFETTHGNIVIQLYDDMPITTENFKKLVSEGFYDGVIFHRVIPNFMVQGGDPTGTGTGGPGYTIEDEFSDKHSNVRGTIAMANTGRPNSGASQFFINVADNSFLDFNKQPLSSKHPVFGEVIEGIDVVDTIVNLETNAQDKPLEEAKILKATIS